MSHVGIGVYYDKNSDILYTVEGNRTINRTEGGASAKSGVVVTKFKTYNRYTAQLIHGYVNLGGTTFGEIPNKSDYKAEHYDD